MMTAVYVTLAGLVLMGLFWAYMLSLKEDDSPYSRFAGTNWRDGSRNFSMPTGSLGRPPRSSQSAGHGHDYDGGGYGDYSPGYDQDN